MINNKILMYIGAFIAYILIIIGLVNIILLIPPFLNIEYDNDWIGFYGSIAGGIIGGGFSFFGVFLTIRYYINKDNDVNEKEIKQKRLLVLPYFKISDTENDDETFARDRTVNFFPRGRQANMITVAQAFIIENIGLGTAVNFKFSSMLYSESDMNDIRFAFKPGDKDQFLLSCDLAHIRGGNTTFLTVEFEDLLGNVYKQTFVLNYKADLANRNISFRSHLKPELC